MTNEHGSSRHRFRKWLLGVCGTLVVGLAAVWANRLFGPKPTYDPCAEFRPQVRERMRDRALADPLVRDTAKSDPDMVEQQLSGLVGIAERGNFQMWVAECGKAMGVYEREFEEGQFADVVIDRARIRISPRAIFKDKEGRECRLLYVSSFMRGEWHSDTVTACRIEGEWRRMRSDGDESVTTDRQ